MASMLLGGPELIKQLTDLSSALGVKKSESVLKRAAKFAMTPTLKEARTTVPVGTEPHKTYRGQVVDPGFAAKNLIAVSKIDRKAQTVRGMVGPTSEAFYATQFIELGTSKIEPNPWLETAFRRTQPEVTSRFQSRIKTLIEREVAKGRKKGLIR